jgi:copper(I)-binding protein
MNVKPFAILILALTINLSANLADAQSTGTIAVANPFSRATPGNSKVGAGFMTITNKGSVADRLVSVTSSAAEKIQIHETQKQGGVTKMRELPDGLPIAAGKIVTLTPGGYHLMLIGLKVQLKQGDKVPITLNFEKSGKVEVVLDVQGIGAQKPSGAMPADSGHMHKM